MRDLMREAEEEESSEEEDEGKPAEPKDLDSKPQPSRRAKKTRSSYSVYDSPVNTVAVLMLGCWTLRIPVTYMDFKRCVLPLLHMISVLMTLRRVIESYDLVYLDPVRLLPATLVRHLTKHTIQALSPHVCRLCVQASNLSDDSINGSMLPSHYMFIVWCHVWQNSCTKNMESSHPNVTSRRYFGELYVRSRAPVSTRHSSLKLLQDPDGACSNFIYSHEESCRCTIASSDTALFSCSCLGTCQEERSVLAQI